MSESEIINLSPEDQSYISSLESTRQQMLLQAKNLELEIRVRLLYIMAQKGLKPEEWQFDTSKLCLVRKAESGVEQSGSSPGS